MAKSGGSGGRGGAGGGGGGGGQGSFAVSNGLGANSRRLLGRSGVASVENAAQRTYDTIVANISKPSVSEDISGAASYGFKSFLKQNGVSTSMLHQDEISNISRIIANQVRNRRP